jgi:hypothetical protein
MPLIRAGRLPSGRDATDANILQSLEKGQGRMPAFAGLSAQEKADLLQYLKENAVPLVGTPPSLAARRHQTQATRSEF